MEETISIIYFIVGIIIIISIWKIFVKAGYAGWKSIIPIYNLYIIQRIINKPWWWVILMLVPFIGIIWTVWSTNLLAKSFGKSEGFTLGLIVLPFIFYPMLGFGDAQYHNPKKDDQGVEIITE